MNPSCWYCGEEMTDDELKAIAEAESLTVEELKENPPKAELMCDKCAEG